MDQSVFLRILAFFFISIFFPLNTTALSAQKIYEKVKNSVYTLYSLDFGTHKIKARGSAVAVSQHILATNCHMALSGNYLIVKVGSKGHVMRLFYKDEKKDLCLLEVPDVDFEPAKVRRSDDVKIGDVVYAIGNPEGTEKSLSQGIISNLHKVDGGTWLQTDAVIYYGSSGGGLFNQEGDLIGITAKMGGNFGFALPADWILDVLQQQRVGFHKKGITQNNSSLEPVVISNEKIDYSKLHADLKLLGVYGQNKVALYRNNKTCFISSPGRNSKNQLMGLMIWNPHYPEKMVIFSNVISVTSALELLLRSIVEGKENPHHNYRSEHVLYLDKSSYPLYGTKSDLEHYTYFIVRFDENPVNALRKKHEFFVQFHDSDPRIGNDKRTYEIDGFEAALAAYEKQCAQ